MVQKNIATACQAPDIHKKLACQSLWLLHPGLVVTCLTANITIMVAGVLLVAIVSSLFATGSLEGDCVIMEMLAIMSMFRRVTVPGLEDPRGMRNIVASLPIAAALVFRDPLPRPGL